MSVSGVSKHRNPIELTHSSIAGVVSRSQVARQSDLVSFSPSVYAAASCHFGSPRALSGHLRGFSRHSGDLASFFRELDLDMCNPRHAQGN